MYYQAMKVSDSWYSEDNFSRIYYSGASTKVAERFHRLLEKNRVQKFNDVLELGATHGHHLKFVNHPYEKYTLSDLRPSQALMAIAELNSRVSVHQIDVTKLESIESKSFDRLVLTCLLHHVNGPENVIEELIRVTRPGGVIDILLPNDPSIFWNLGRLIFTVPKALRQGFTWKQYWDYVKIEHINGVKELQMMVRESVTRHKLRLEIDTWPFSQKVPLPMVYFRYSIVISL